MILYKTPPLLLLQFLLMAENPGIEATHGGGCPLCGGRSVLRDSLGKPRSTQDQVTSGCGQGPDICPETKYRSYDGSCNNLKNPSLGVPQTKYNRILPANYGDGISTPTVAKSGKPLPSARAVSASLYRDVHIEDPLFNLIAMQFGQIIAHDMSFASGTAALLDCCSDDGENADRCIPIEVPADDPAYSQYNISCLSLSRTVTDKDKGCMGESQTVEQLTEVNHYLDLSIVYGNSDQVNQQVRAFRGGRLISEQRNDQEWLPTHFNKTVGCFGRVDSNETCYMAGDSRVNQNPQLTIIQTLLFREHNRIADILAKINPLWDDEAIFQESRKINIAQFQHISYYEWLPIFIGRANALKNRIIWETKSWVNDYDSTVDPSILNEHATAAFRFFHTLIAGHLDLVNEMRINDGNARLSDWFFRPGILEQNKSFDGLTRGMTTQAELHADVYHDKEITLNWFRDPKQPLGQDLKAVCIQRNRDHGLASYNDYRFFCGRPKAKTFEDFLDVISKDNVNRLAALYEHPDDVEFTVGGSVEIIEPGTLAGPTFLCILTEQFYRTRVGDRFWFENSGDVGFTKPQLKAIRKTSIARIICDNSLDIEAMQPRAFEKISHSNDVKPCRHLPSVNLSLWKE